MLIIAFISRYLTYVGLVEIDEVVVSHKRQSRAKRRVTNNKLFVTTVTGSSGGHPDIWKLLHRIRLTA